MQQCLSFSAGAPAEAEAGAGAGAGAPTWKLCQQQIEKLIYNKEKNSNNVYLV